MPDACVGCCRSCREQVKHDLEHRLWEAGSHAKYKSAETKREIVLKMQNAQDAALTQGDASGAAALGAVAKGPLGSVGIMAPVHVRCRGAPDVRVRCRAGHRERPKAHLRAQGERQEGQRQEGSCGSVSSGGLSVSSELRVSAQFRGPKEPALPVRMKPCVCDRPN